MAFSKAGFVLLALCMIFIESAYGQCAGKGSFLTLGSDTTPVRVACTGIGVAHSCGDRCDAQLSTTETDFYGYVCEPSQVPAMFPCADTTGKNYPGTGNGQGGKCGGTCGGQWKQCGDDGAGGCKCMNGCA